MNYGQLPCPLSRYFICDCPAIAPLPGCSTGDAYAINDLGQAVGWCGSNAVLWADGEMTVIGPDVALGIDNKGRVVGRTSDDTFSSQPIFGASMRESRFYLALCGQSPFPLVRRTAISWVMENSYLNPRQSD
jgi:hypothetical protein